MSDQSKIEAPGHSGARKRAVAVETIAILRTLFSPAFPPDHRCPLKLGIHRDLQARLATSGSAISRTALRVALRLYTNDGDYLRALVEGAPRVDLDGQAAGTVTAGESAAAQARLDVMIARAGRASKRKYQSDKLELDKPSSMLTSGKASGWSSKSSTTDHVSDDGAARLNATRISLQELRAAGAARRRGGKAGA